MRSQQKTITVATSATQLLGPDPKRVNILIQNTGGSDVYIGFGNTAIVGDGFCIHPGQRPTRFLWHDYGERLWDPVWAIANSVASTVVVREAFT